MPKKTVLLLGGTGAMGVYLIPELVSLGYEVHITSRKSHPSQGSHVHYIVGNGKDNAFLSAVLQKHYDAIVDFMVYHTEEFEKRAELLLSSTDHYLFLSSYRVYGDLGRKPITEDSPRLLDSVDDETYLQTDEYGLTKARQENILMSSDYDNWTILRPAITFSKTRFQLGTMEAEEFLYRALRKKPVVFPREMLDKEATMTWAGDVAKLIARLVLKRDSFKEAYTVSTSEHHTWREIADYYKEFLGIDIKIISLEQYTKLFGRPYQIKYDRMFNRIIDNKKILLATDIQQSDFLNLREGLKIELTDFSKKPEFTRINKDREKEIDKITETPIKTAKRRLRQFRKRVKFRTRLRQPKAFFNSRTKYEGAIVSLGGYYNYGSVIQRYALQQFLKANGLRFKLLDFKFMHSASAKTGDRTKLKQFADKYYDQETFNPRLSRYYKAYIVGSDQVWRDFFNDWTKFGRFFLNFVKDNKTIRVAYAASFGKDTLTGAGIDGAKQKRIKPLLKKFDAISVREPSGVKLVRWLGCKAEVTLDPTLLMPMEFYSDLIDNSSVADRKMDNLFCYILDNTSFKSDVINQFKQKIGATSFEIYPNNGKPLEPLELWLKGFRDSDFVITDSFHGTVFSIINHKEFVVFGNQSRGLARIAELLEQLGIHDRIIPDNGGFIMRDFEPVNWSDVDSRLSDLGGRSAQWLLNALNTTKG